VSARVEVTVRLAVLLALATAPTAALAASEPVAVVASVKGRVEISSARAKGQVRAVFGRPLERGDRVSVGPGGAATLFFNDGNVIELAERSAITIGGRVAAAQRGGALPGDVYAQVSRFVTAGSRQTGLVAMARMRSSADESAPLLLAPRRTSILTDAPALSWRAVAGAARYRVRVTPPDGSVLWSRDVPAGTSGVDLSLPYPEDAPRLAADTDYQWDVEALDAEGSLRREGTVVRVLPPAMGADVRANLTRITDGAGGADSPATRFLAGSYLSGLGLYQDAVREFRALTALAPESPGPHEALGNLYSSVGLMDLAASEFQRALALQRDAR
jgi:hypothetical protein